jgi:hypothetical protein
MLFAGLLVEKGLNVAGWTESGSERVIMLLAGLSLAVKGLNVGWTESGNQRVKCCWLD